MERLVEAISMALFLRKVVGIGSRLQCDLSDWESKSEISHRVAGVQW